MPKRSTLISRSPVAAFSATDMTRPALALAAASAAPHPGAALESISAIEAALAGLPTGQAGIRLFDNDRLRQILSGTGAIGSIAADALSPDARPVRAILFDKTAATNWALGWHQDRTIAVQTRH